MAVFSDQLALPASLEDAKIGGLTSAFYIADFITKEEEQIAAAPKPRWRQLTHRRLLTYPSDLTAKDVLLDAPLPKWLSEPTIARLCSIPVIPGGGHIFTGSPHLGAPNHVLINEYLPGQGILPHKDGSAYYPVVCTVSLAASLCLDIYGANDDGTTQSEPRWKILQEPRSLLITTGKLYTDYLHGIADITADRNLDSNTVANWQSLRAPQAIEDGINERQVRVSLTFRNVIKVSILGGKLLAQR